MPLRAVILLIFFVASVPVCFIRPFYGIVLWIIVAFLNPQSFTWTSFDIFPWAAAVAVPTMLGTFAFERRFGRLASREVALLVVMWIWFTVTTLVSTSLPEFAHHAPETWDKWKFVSKIMLMTVFMIPVVSTFDRLRYLVLTIGACFGFYVLKVTPFVISTGGEFRLYGPEKSMIGDNNDFGLALNMTLPLFFFLAQTETNRWVKRFMAFMFIITIPAVFFTYSRGALVGLLAVFALMLLQSRRRLALVPVVALGLFLALSFAPEKWQERMDLTRSSLDSSAQARLAAWKYARALAADYPITGGGFATFTEQLFERYWPGQVGLIYGAHSVYFQVLAEHGYVGLTLYLLLVLSCLATTRRLRKAARRRNDHVIALYAHMFQLSLVAFLVSGIFLGRAYFDYFFTIVACVIALERAVKDRWAPAAGAPQAPPVQAQADALVLARKRAFG